MLRALLRLVGVAVAAVAILGLVATIAGLTSSNPPQTLVGVAVTIVAGALVFTIAFADRMLGADRTDD